LACQKWLKERNSYHDKHSDKQGPDGGAEGVAGAIQYKVRRNVRLAGRRTIIARDQAGTPPGGEFSGRIAPLGPRARWATRQTPHNFTVVTRNTEDFPEVDTLNPFEH